MAGKIQEKGKSAAGVGRPKGSCWALRPRDRLVLKYLNEGLPNAQAFIKAGFKDPGQFNKWKLRPAVKKMLEENTEQLKQAVAEKGFETVGHLLNLVSVRSRMSNYIEVGRDGLPTVNFPKNIMDGPDADLPTYVSTNVRVIGTGANQRVLKEVKFDYPDDNVTAMNIAKLNGELVDRSRVEMTSEGQDNDIFAAREYAAKRREPKEVH